MLRSMYSAIGGLRGFQNKLDVIGNNIANVNTVGFKKGRIEFQDMLSQAMSGGNAPTATSGGTNPKQVGLGSTISTIDTIHTQGGAMTTNVPTDLMIQGNGFFIVSPTGKVDATKNAMTKEDYFLTRAGNFGVDADGNLATSNGMYVMGTVTDGNATTPTTLQKINLLQDKAGNRLAVAPTAPATNGVPVKVKSFSIGTDGSITVVYDQKPTGTVPAAGGALMVFPAANSNEVSKMVVGLATVANPGGLEKSGNNLYKVNGSSNGNMADDTVLFMAGDTTAGHAPTGGAKGVMIGAPNSAERGPVYSGMLEMSNTDLSEEFTEMIVAQRGFQANSRIITTSDSILEELVNLKR
ncbi:flagellar hook protein FlgE [Aneurinibacillus soli]|uniref:Flagellar hook protein FlgE n=1 Tax=Aneurinibacillus soli TaxID=1500254 RepID=A0A0U4WG14_9BACL|nr:flagellar hook-basal body complex protein [Aneurinibacillus soli]PYE63393.1 flagellar hook protein FlgE [Aneurinibacillus soli]BAU27675.1 Flagellar basal-body rod protein FlgG [Aneurinibacillus soli]